MLEDLLRNGFNALEISYDRMVLERFRTYYTLLDERGRQMNLTAIRGEDEVAVLHFLDCAAILKLANWESKRVLDVGSGAGFPGIVLKILNPSVDLSLLDSLNKRVLFQKEVCDALGFTDVRCLSMRAEDAPAEMRETFDLVVSRAVARLNLLAELCIPFVRSGGHFLAMKGAAAEEELEEARDAFRILGSSASLLSYSVPGLEASRALIDAIKISSTPSRYPRAFGQMKKKPL